MANDGDCDAEETDAKGKTLKRLARNWTTMWPIIISATEINFARKAYAPKAQGGIGLEKAREQVREHCAQDEIWLEYTGKAPPIVKTLGGWIDATLKEYKARPTYVCAPPRVTCTRRRTRATRTCTHHKLPTILIDLRHRSASFTRAERWVRRRG